jgi:hypothetical protein
MTIEYTVERNNTSLVAERFRPQFDSAHHRHFDTKCDSV